MATHDKKCRIVLTGGPGGGKTTAADFLRRELGEKVVVVPEAATLLYGGGFPRSNDIEVTRAGQRAIYHVQRSLEDAFHAHYPERILLCDRGTVDAAAYWPNHTETFFDHIGTSLAEEYARYDAVVFFETAAAGGISVESPNKVRIENMQEALKLDRILHSAWKNHSNFSYIPHTKSFLAKISSALEITQNLIAQLT